MTELRELSDTELDAVCGGGLMWDLGGLGGGVTVVVDPQINLLNQESTAVALAIGSGGINIPVATTGSQTATQTNLHG